MEHQKVDQKDLTIKYLKRENAELLRLLGQKNKVEPQQKVGSSEVQLELFGQE